MLRTLRLPALLAALSFPLALAACNTGTKAGDTNVELSAPKKMQANKPQGNINGDSLAAGIPRDTARRPSGKQVYKNADRAVDRNHDGLAD
jgi:predicted small secreted protein